MSPHHLIFGHLLLAKKSAIQSSPECTSLIFARSDSSLSGYGPGLRPRHVADHLSSSLGCVLAIGSKPIPSGTRARKSPELRRWMRLPADNQDFASLEGQTWKKWFNPGFSASHLIRLVPQIGREVSLFCGILKERAQDGAVFLPEEATLYSAMDTIGQVCCKSFDGLRIPVLPLRRYPFYELISAFRAQIPWNVYGTEINPSVRWNPFRPYF